MLEHLAALRLTGWAQPEPGGCRIAGLRVQLPTPFVEARRISLEVRPRTDPQGLVQALGASRVRPARAWEPNGTQFRITGQVLKLDRGEGVIVLKLSPASKNRRPFRVTLRASRALLRALPADPDPVALTVRGELLTLGDHSALIATRADVVHAPVPKHWRGWRPPRRPSPRR